MTEKNVLTEIREDIIIAILNRPDALNALNDDLMDELSKIVEQYEENTDLKCLILTGSEKAFAAGADIKQMQPKSYMDVYKEDFITRNKLSPVLEKKSMTNYFNINYPDNTSKEVWFDDDYTLGKKYDFALTNKLKGVGIWALGYDNGYNELWDVIENKFATDKLKVEDPVGQIEGYPIKVSSYILEKRDLLLVTSLFFLFAVAIGFIITLSDWKVRDSIARNQFHRFIMVMIVFIFLTPIVYLINELFFLKSNWKYYVVFILGVLTLYLTSLIKIKSIKKP